MENKKYTLVFTEQEAIILYQFLRAYRDKAAPAEIKVIDRVSSNLGVGEPEEPWVISTIVEAKCPHSHFPHGHVRVYNGEYREHKSWFCLEVEKLIKWSKMTDRWIATEEYIAAGEDCGWDE